MALVRWDPFRELTALQTEVNRLFSRAGGGDVAERQSWTPSIDVIETDDSIKLKAELAGMDPKDISIEVQDNVLTVSGERRFEEEVKEDKYYRIERRYGSFSRSLALPQAVKPITAISNLRNMFSILQRSGAPQLPAPELIVEKIAEPRRTVRIRIS